MRDQRGGGVVLELDQECLLRAREGGGRARQVRQHRLNSLRDRAAGVVFKEPKHLVQRAAGFQAAQYPVGVQFPDELGFRRGV